MDILLPQILPISEEDWRYYLSFSPREYLQEIVLSLKGVSRFFVDNRFNKLLFYYAFEPNSRYQAQTSLYEYEIQKRIFSRARIYKELDAGDRFGNPQKYGVFQGYDAEGSFVPPENRWPGQGRINPEGIRYLYTSSDVHTCLLEVGAQPNDYVSVGQIALKETVHMIDFSKDFSALDCVNLERSKWMNSFVLEVVRVFQKPFVENGDYLLCQYISEFYKTRGFDGIIFQSAKAFNTFTPGHGKNYIFFNYQKCEVLSSKLYYIVQVNIETSPDINAKG